MSAFMYSVVFGPEWEDIEYYDEYDKALEALKNETTHLKEFTPVLQVFVSKNGKYKSLKNIQFINNEPHEVSAFDIK